MDFDTMVQAKLRQDSSLDFDGAVEEVVADACELMLRDSKAIETLAKENQSLFEKIRDWLKKFAEDVRKAFQGKEARHAEAKAMLDYVDELVELWDKGLLEARESRGRTQKPEENNPSFSLREFEDGRRFVDVTIDQEQFDGLTISEMNNKAKQIIKSKFGGKVVGIDNKAFVNGNSAEKYAYFTPGTDKSIIEAKARASTELDNLIDAGTNFRKAEDGADGHIHPDVVDGFSYFDTVFKAGNQYYSGTINIKNIGKGKLFWGITKTKNITQDLYASYGENPTSMFLRDVSMRRLPQKEPNVKKSRRDTEDNVIRFSLREPVEETKDLIAVHNLTAEKLQKTLELGGFAMPSIAIVKAEAGHTEFGEISVVFPKDTIDPKRAENKVYSGDAWTPVFPQVEYEADEAAASRISDTVNTGYFEEAVAYIVPDDTDRRMISELEDKGLNVQTYKARDNADRLAKLNAVSSRMKFSRRSFSEQVDEILHKGTFDRAEAVYVGETPKILGDVGLNVDLPMLTTQKHIRNAVLPKNTRKHQHGLKESQLKRIPEEVAHPAILLDSFDQSRNTVIAVTGMVDQDKSPIIVTIKADGKGMYNNIEVSSNFVTSYYGRDGFEGFIKRAAENGLVLFVDKEKATALSAESSTSWLEQLKDYDFDTIIRKRGLVVNPKNKINHSRRDSSIYLTPEQARAQAASYTRLKAENRYLRDKLNFWKGQTKVTELKTVRDKDVRSLARRLVNEYSSAMDITEVRQQLRELGNRLVQDRENIDYVELGQQCWLLAQDMIENAEAYVETGYEGMAADIKQDIKGYRMLLYRLPQKAGKVVCPPGHTGGGLPPDRQEIGIHQRVFQPHIRHKPLRAFDLSTAAVAKSSLHSLRSWYNS